MVAVWTSAISLRTRISTGVLGERSGAERMTRSTLHDDGGVETRLTVELVPSTCCTPRAVERAEGRVGPAGLPGGRRRGDRCEICGGRGRRRPVESHEVWDYAD
jgi:hypothetical protein